MDPQQQQITQYELFPVRPSIDTKETIPYQGSVNLQVNAAQQALIIEFSITKAHSFHTQWVTPKTPQSPYPERNWGLWEQSDVVEVFFQPRSTLETWDMPYTEWQCSPLGTGFALEILRPRIQYYCPLASAWNAQTELGSQTWKTQIRLPHHLIATPYFGLGLFACLGAKEFGERYYFSHISNQVLPANFHQPENFLALQWPLSHLN